MSWCEEVYSYAVNVSAPQEQRTRGALHVCIAWHIYYNQKYKVRVDVTCVSKPGRGLVSLFPATTRANLPPGESEHVSLGEMKGNSKRNEKRTWSRKQSVRCNKLLPCFFRVSVWTVAPWDSPLGPTQTNPRRGDTDPTVG